jgi:hypothetical protein
MRDLRVGISQPLLIDIPLLSYSRVRIIPAIALPSLLHLPTNHSLPAQTPSTLQTPPADFPALPVRRISETVVVKFINERERFYDQRFFTGPQRARSIRY